WLWSGRRRCRHESDRVSQFFGSRFAAFRRVATRGRFRLSRPGAIAVVLRSVPGATTADDGTASDTGDHRDVSGNPRSASPAGPEQPLQCGPAILRIPLANRPAML